MKKFLLSTVLAATVLGTAAGAIAQANVSACPDKHDYGSETRVCEMRTYTRAATGSVSVESDPNGGISVEGSSRQDVEISARVEAWGKSEAEAQERLKSVTVETAGKIHAKGPSDGHWSVSFHVMTPMQTNVTASAHNGGVSLSDVNGELNARTVNGGLTLRNLGGTLTGQTENGGIHLELSGDTWQGSGASVTATNGGIKITMPQNYRAHVEAGTVNGGVHSSLAISGSSTQRNRLNGDVNGGGPTIKAETVNGGVSIN